MSVEARNLVVASLAGLVVNLVSGALGTTPVAIVVGLFALAVVILSQLRRADQVSIPAVLSGRNLDFAVFFVAAFVLGIAVGAICVIPLFPSVLFQIPFGNEVFGASLTPFHGYELLAAGIITALAVLALLRKQRLVRAITFVVSATAGSSFAVSALLPRENDFATTFIGWAISSVLALSVLALLPRLVDALRAFWSPQLATATPSSSASKKQESDDQPDAD